MIKIEHAVLATKFLRGKGGKDLAASQRNMKGYLYHHDGTIIKMYCISKHLHENALIILSSIVGLGLQYMQRNKLH